MTNILIRHSAGFRALILSGSEGRFVGALVLGASGRTGGFPPVRRFRAEMHQEKVYHAHTD